MEDKNCLGKQNYSAVILKYFFTFMICNVFIYKHLICSLSHSDTSLTFFLTPPPPLFYFLQKKAAFLGLIRTNYIFTVGPNKPYAKTKTGVILQLLT